VLFKKLIKIDPSRKVENFVEWPLPLRGAMSARYYHHSTPIRSPDAAPQHTAGSCTGKRKARARPSAFATPPHSEKRLQMQFRPKQRERDALNAHGQYQLWLVT
jgi:hypothetical protein